VDFGLTVLSTVSSRYVGNVEVTYSGPPRDPDELHERWAREASRMRALLGPAVWLARVSPAGVSVMDSLAGCEVGLSVMVVAQRRAVLSL
jgi:hypothetical protein